MRISKELIEKYHDGNCSPEEQAAVEDWLFNDDVNAQLILPAENKARIRDEMWEEIASVLPRKESAGKVHFFKPFWRQAAAVLLISMAGVLAFYLKNQTNKSGVIVVHNASETINKNLNESEYTLAIGPKSNVEINYGTGQMDFCGAVMINPKKDIELTIQGTCARPGEKSEKMTLKKGQNYIALNYGDASESNEVIILPQGSLMGLPPLVQRQLMIQFNI